MEFIFLIIWVVFGILIAAIAYKFKISSGNTSVRFPAKQSENSSVQLEPADISPELALTNSSPQALAVTKRYRDAYLVANFVTNYGALLKILGIIGGGGIGFLGFFIGAALNDTISRNSFGASRGDGVFFTFLVIFGLIGCFVAAIFWVLGVLVSAQGQILKASLDGTVNNSPFLTNEERARIMSLPSA
jgi:predicted membrane protein